MGYWLVKAVLTPILRLLFRPYVTGAENLPPSGGAVLAGNHTTFLDNFMIPLVVPRRVTFLAKSDYFTGGGVKGLLQRTFFSGVGMIPIDRSGGKASEAALNTGLKVLRRGDLLGLYPEGTRSPDGRLYRGRTGIARVVLEAGVPVIPVGLIGMFELQPAGKRLPRLGRVEVRIGRPLDFSRYSGMEDDRFVLRSITDEIMYELMLLSGQEYVDTYATKAKADLEQARQAPAGTPATGRTARPAEVLRQLRGPTRWDGGVRTDDGSRLDGALWRAVAAARGASLLYAGSSAGYYLHRGAYARPGVAVAALVVMAGWTLLVTVLLADPRRRTSPLLAADLAVVLGVLLSGLLAHERLYVEHGGPTLTLSWGAVPVLSWAVRGGPVAGALAAAAVSAATVVWRGELDRPTFGSCVLLLLAGAVVGYVVSLARGAEQAYAQVVRRETAQAERERLSRQVHDGVLQALALVARRSSDAELVGLAHEQEAALRRLVAAGPVAVVDGTVDLRGLLPAGADVQLAAPAGPVVLPAAVGQELAAAVHACVDNVRRHAGGTAWLLVEDEPDAVTVSVRDDGPGMPPGRLAEAAAEGRLGVSRSVCGRLRDLGGTAQVTSAPGAGTEVELRVPRSRPVRG